MAPDPAQTPDLPDLHDLAAAIEHALDVLEDLITLGEDIEDEWQYVQDLGASWRERLASVAAARDGETLASQGPAATAIRRLGEEARLIDDRHRAIDWLSTFPQAVLVALGERP